ncbi:MAG: response regulator transcription factor [Bacteroidota bacterium]|uniref:response regulator transcription factor n=1 Tax=Christiangramia sp. TaxID=1931228 RepID=UPI000C37A02B|nr:DNA-binding response regulator [Christiangramia sp.]MEE2770701.1 response regulator transcription factor [Bacteroidota bacterium]
MNRSIIIVDDHRLFAQSLRGLVNSLDGFEVTAAFKNGSELVGYLGNGVELPEIILLDMRMPVMDGMQTMQWLKQHHPEQKVLALTVDQEENTIIKMLKLGCRGYLLKDIDPDEFEEALKAVAEEGYYTNRTISDALSSSASHKKNQEELSARETEFLGHACSELTYKQIAEQMHLSPKTIDGYRESLFSKLRVRSRVGLVIYAIKEGIHQI